MECSKNAKNVTFCMSVSDSSVDLIPPSLAHSSVCCVCCVYRSLSQGSANAAVLDVTQTGGHKKRVRRSSFLNAKKLYEDAQMARKVKQYLSNLTLETNEESLQTLSIQCEPSISTREPLFLCWIHGNLTTTLCVNTLYSHLYICISVSGHSA